MIPSESIVLALGIFFGWLLTRIATQLYQEIKEVFDHLYRYARVKAEINQIVKDLKK